MTGETRLRGFVESKFGFWLVTSVLVGIVTIAHAFFQTYFQQAAQRQTQLARLDLEVEYRLSQYMTGLAHMTRGAEANLKDGYTPEDVRSLTYVLVGTPAQVKDVMFFSMYPKDFGDRALASLLAEKASLRPQMAEVFRDQLAKVTGYVIVEGRDFSKVLPLATDVNRLLFPGNASGEFFHYTDCPAERPFC